MNNQVNNPISNPTIKPVKKSSKITIIVSAVTAFMALMATVTWFMPVASIGSRAYTMLETLDQLSSSQAEEALIGFWFIVIFFAVNIVWAIVPKMWAAIVGIAYSFFTMIFGIVQVADWAGNNLDLAVGAVFLALFSILLFITSIVKLVFTIMDRKKNRISNSNYSVNQPPTATM